LAQAPDIDFTVLYAMLPDAHSQGAGFGVAFEWDIPLLECYPYRVLKNISRSPGVTHFKGCDTPDIKSVLREMRVDIVVVNGWVVKTCLQTLRACKSLGIPCIVRGEANNLRPRPLWKRWLQRLLVRKYDAALPIGIANREFYRSHGISDTRMFHARYCIENERFMRAAFAAETHREERRKQWNIPPHAICFLYCGKFETKKHPIEALEAFLRAHRSLRSSKLESPTIHLLMVGDGDLKKQCELQLQNDGLTHTSDDHPPVTFTGFLNQSEIVDAYVAADCLVLASDHGETWGLVVNEAFACARPAIVTDLVGCANDLVIEGETGFCFPYGDWDQLTELFRSLANGSAKLSEMGSAASRRIQAYSPQAAADGIVAAVNHLLRRDAGN
jgi:glycosyltransferase involved in cell wall biosynthesis